MSLESSVTASRTWVGSYVAAWDRFWFTPRKPHTLVMLRVVTGLFLLYSHLVLATDLQSFLGDHAWINNETARWLHDGAFGFSDFGRTYLWYLGSPTVLWLHHGLTLIVTASFAAGFLTRITAPAAWFLQLMYLHRMTGTLFGFDQIITYSTMYLMLSPCGSLLSVDAYLRKRLADRWSADRRLQWLFPDASPTVAANIATRLFQLHMCVIYLFGGLSKARGQTWWDGSAMWYSVGNYEYQSLDMTWIANYPRLFSAMTHVTLFWEVFYCVLVWPRLTRPFVLAAAVMVHGGIALFLGMITFGTMMIAANMIFVRPESLIWLVRRLQSGRSGVPEEESEVAGADTGGESLGTDFGSEVPAGEADLEAFTLEELGLEEVDLDSHGSDILQRGVDPDASASGILDNLMQREASLARREQRLRQASLSLKEKKKRLNDQLDKYNQRVSRLKQREMKIKRLVERKRAGKESADGESSP